LEEVNNAQILHVIRIIHGLMIANEQLTKCTDLDWSEEYILYETLNKGFHSYKVILYCKIPRTKVEQ